MNQLLTLDKLEGLLTCLLSPPDPQDRLSLPTGMAFGLCNTPAVASLEQREGGGFLNRGYLVRVPPEDGSVDP